jgi:hypothetical protein
MEASSYEDSCSTRQQQPPSISTSSLSGNLNGFESNQIIIETLGSTLSTFKMKFSASIQAVAAAAVFLLQGAGAVRISAGP